MKRDPIDFRADAYARPAETLQETRTKPFFPERRMSLESLAYGGVMTSMFVAILVYLVVTIVGA